MDGVGCEQRWGDVAAAREEGPHSRSLCVGRAAAVSEGARRGGRRAAFYGARKRAYSGVKSVRCRVLGNGRRETRTIWTWAFSEKWWESMSRVVVFGVVRRVVTIKPARTRLGFKRSSGVECCVGRRRRETRTKRHGFCFWVWVGSLQLELYWFCVWVDWGGGARKRWIDVQLDSRKRAHRSSLSAFTLTNRRNKRLNLSRS